MTLKTCTLCDEEFETGGIKNGEAVYAYGRVTDDGEFQVVDGLTYCPDCLLD